MTSQPPTSLASPGKVLILFPRQLGDVLLATSISRVLKTQFPEAKLFWCAHPMARQILEDNPHLERTFYYPKKFRLPKRGKLESLIAYLFHIMIAYIAYIKEELSLLSQLHKQKIDVAIVPMSNLRTILQAFCSGAKLRIGVRGDCVRNLAFHHLVDRQELTKQYLGSTLLQFLEPLGLKAQRAQELGPQTVLPVSDLDREKAAQFLQSRTIPAEEKGFVCLSPTHRHAIRKWAPEHFVDLAFLLISRHQVSVVWLWGPGEREEVETLHQALRMRLQEAGLSHDFTAMPPLLSLRETAALCQCSVGWVGNSNGLSHIAVAGGARTVQIHGPTSGSAWTHPDLQRHRIAQRQTGCTQCNQNICRQPRRECLDDLSIDDVYNHAREIFFAPDQSEAR